MGDTLLEMTVTAWVDYRHRAGSVAYRTWLIGWPCEDQLLRGWIIVTVQQVSQMACDPNELLAAVQS